MMRRRTIRSAMALAVCCALSAPLAAQEPVAEPFDPSTVPFELWLAEGNREDIRWSVRVRGPRLTVEQWQNVTLDVEVRGSTLARLGPEAKLIQMAAVADSDGRWIARQLARWETTEKLPSRVRVVFTTPVVLQPGEYTLGIVLYERESGARSVYRRPLRVPRIQNDPLAGAPRSEVRAEITGPVEGLDSLFRPELPPPVRLEAATRERVAVELLVNFTPPEFYSGRRGVYWNNVRTLLGALKILSQLELPNGQVNVTAVDLLRQRVLFQQVDARGLDWPRLRAALETTDPGVIDLRALEHRRQSAAFFREVLAERLAPEAEGADSSAYGSPRPEPARRVLIVLSTGYLFPGGSDRTPVAVPADCNCSVYLLENRLTAASLWDHLRKMMGPLPFRRIVMESPMDFRKALAEILKDLRRM
jgi:hypothetical protein